MVDPELTRRKVLSGMAVAGTAGALVGSGTVSLFSDEEASNISFTGGVVKLDVNGEAVDETIELDITLPGDSNNPARIWVRAVACPDPTADARLIHVEVRFDGSTIAEGSLFDVLTGELGELRTGALLTEEDCFDPGDGEKTLSIEPTNTDELSNDVGPVKIKLQVFAEQCRHNSDPDPPFDPVIEKGDCETPNAGGKALSFVSFCVKGTDASNPEPAFTNLASDEDGPTSVMWDTSESTEEIEYVVAKAGNEITIYDYTGSDPKMGTVTTGVDEDADFVKDYSTSDTPNLSELDPNPAKAPCGFAVQELADNTSLSLTSYKYEPDDEEPYEWGPEQ